MSKNHSAISPNGKRSPHLHVDLGHRVVTVLLDDAGFAFDEFRNGFIRPPRYPITVLIELSTRIVETMRDLVANHHTDA